MPGLEKCAFSVLFFFFCKSNFMDFSEVYDTYRQESYVNVSVRHEIVLPFIPLYSAEL